MVLLVLKVVFGIIIASAVAFFTIKKDKNKTKPYIPSLIGAVLTVFTSYFTDIISIKNSDPKVQVIVNKQREGEILLSINKQPKKVRTLDIDFPILGKIENIHGFSSNTEYKMISKRVLGEQIVNSQNNVQISIDDISDSLEVFSFKILFIPMQIKMTIPLLNHFCYRYTWDHNGS